MARLIVTSSATLAATSRRGVLGATASEAERRTVSYYTASLSRVHIHTDMSRKLAI